MADKQATVYIIDQGSTLGDCHNGRIETDLQFGMRYVWDKIATTMAANRTTWSIGIIGLRTNGTSNPLAPDDDSYHNIEILKELGPMDMSHLNNLQARIQPSSTEHGDAISAIVIALQMIEKFTMLKSGKPGKYKRKVVLLTDGQGNIAGEDLDPIVTRINEIGVELVVLGIDFDDEEFGFREEHKSTIKESNESLLKSFVEKCNNGVFGTAAEAVENISIPEVKDYRPYSTFEGRLCLGDPMKYPETAMVIDVKRYFKTKQAKPLSASSFVTRIPIVNESTQSSHTLPGDTEMIDAPDLTAVKSNFKYQVNDANAPAGKKEVDREELSKGFEYGRTIVPVSESDQNVTKIETFQSFSIIGFIPNDKYERFLNMGESCITVAQNVNTKAKLALSSLIHALHELDSYAVARLVKKDGNDPLLVLLAPLIEPDMEALIDVPIPFAEDVRVYQFPPLDRVILTSGVATAKHRYLPSHGLVDAMSDYVDSMDLSTFGKDDEGEPAEYMPFDETYSPVIHRINQALRKRAIHPNGPIDPPADILMKWSDPPSELVKKAAPELEKLVKAADVKKVTPKKKGTRNRQEAIKPLSGLDVDSLLDRDTRQKISLENAIPEFKQLMNNTTSENDIQEAADQMAKIIRKLITPLKASIEFPRVIANMKVLREELLSIESPDVYNEFIRDFKNKLVKGELGGDRREFWFQVRKNGLGLVDDKEYEHSEVTEEEAAQFLDIKTDLPSRSK